MSSSDSTLHHPWGTPSSSEDGRVDPTMPPNVSQVTIAQNYALPTDIATLHSIINTLLELQATSSVNTHLAACFARLKTEQAPSTLDSTATNTDAATAYRSTTPAPCQYPNRPCTIASGGGAASPEVFNKIIKTNWHGRLGRTHMVDVDALSPMALTELDCLLRRKLRPVFPRGCAFSAPDPDAFFASLASLGLRLEDRGNYADVPDTPANQLYNAPMTRRGDDLVAWYYAHNKYGDYWKGVAVETMMELARYRGLFDEEGFLI